MAADQDGRDLVHQAALRILQHWMQLNARLSEDGILDGPKADFEVEEIVGDLEMALQPLMQIAVTDDSREILAKLARFSEYLEHGYVAHNLEHLRSLNARLEAAETSFGGPRPPETK